MRASKYIKFTVLLDDQEMQNLLNELPAFHILVVGRVTPQIELSYEDFLHNHCSYLASIKDGKEFQDSLSLAFTTDLKAVDILEYGERKLVRPRLPVVQLQRGCLRYSKESRDFQIGTLGEGMSWGIQFSYPFLFQSDEGEIAKVDSSFPNTELFLKLQRWVRGQTKATPFLVDGKRVNVPVRLGKSCFSWINGHRDLKELSVVS